jgi:SAM-dependent methyltransferase
MRAPAHAPSSLLAGFRRANPSPEIPVLAAVLPDPIAAMEGYGAKTYGDWIAEDYDHLHVGRHDTDACVDLLAGLAREGPVLELGVGTGRVALPLAARGLQVHGIDVSEAMVERLRAKPGGETVRVTFGDFAEVPVTGTFRLVFVVFNTLFALPSQDDQVRCFARVAERLGDGGAFVVEAFVPDPARLAQRQELTVDDIGLDHVWLTATHRDPSPSASTASTWCLQRAACGCTRCRSTTRGRRSWT